MRRPPLKLLVGAALSGYAVAIFVVLWGGLLSTLVAGPGLLSASWAWLQRLDALPQIVAWIAGLPIAVGLWAWHADLADTMRAAIGVGLVAWTSLAVSAFSRTLSRLGERHPSPAGRRRRR